ncbi:TetR family transcriptional regulator [Conexibacter arvalis]|uniref:AcrR family transcriptional regulator n=1 Tax=Conexibacter arvalis TaxID=912552 RepID=A0A840I8Q2_9ACTN|nr:TetR family transcriptional regulator [Conexibacter arvalis]MBB4661246.1 AcrR family transcriptional regulator [Conexibacter arvalis]
MRQARTPYAVAARELLRETLFDAARDLIQERPWAEVTMAEVAAAAGVSRQTLYKEFGSRDEFAQLFVVREGTRFLEAVEQAVRSHFGDSRAALAAALGVFLDAAAEDQLVIALLRDDGTGGMLPLVTTQSQPVVAFASARLVDVICEGWPQAERADAEVLAECLVRLALSYAMLPKDPPEQTIPTVMALIEPFVERALGAG